MDIDEGTFLEKTQEAVIDWYKQADAKAQVILGFTGVFLSLTVGSLLSMPPNSKLSQYSVIVTLPIFLFYAISILLSMAALWSRGIFRDKSKGVVFFGRIANYETEDELKKGIHATINTEEYINQFRRSILVLSRNTRHKHRLVNVAAILSGLGLISTLALAFAVLSAN